jgi:hypothetical protein
VLPIALLDSSQGAPASGDISHRLPTHPSFISSSQRSRRIPRRTRMIASLSGSSPGGQDYQHRTMARHSNHVVEQFRRRSSHHWISSNCRRTGGALWARAARRSTIAVNNLVFPVLPLIAPMPFVLTNYPSRIGARLSRQTSPIVAGCSDRDRIDPRFVRTPRFSFIGAARQRRATHGCRRDDISDSSRVFPTPGSPNAARNDARVWAFLSFAGEEAKSTSICSNDFARTSSVPSAATAKSSVGRKQSRRRFSRTSAGDCASDPAHRVDDSAALPGQRGRRPRRFRA